MPPRIHLRPTSLPVRTSINPPQRCLYASLATTPAPSIDHIHASAPISHYPPTQPPSHKPPEVRKSQLLRQYTSLLRSTPFLLFFQHNNLRAAEWVAVRRELVHALTKVDEQLAADGRLVTPLAAEIKIQTVQTGMLKPAMRIVEFFKPGEQKPPPSAHPTDPKIASSAEIALARPTPEDEAWTHVLSRIAHKKTNRRKLKDGMEVLLSGPIAVIAFPSVSPQHLKAVLATLAPSKEIPAPKRKQRPQYHEPVTQSGLQKLLLLAARVEGKVFDQEGVRWIGGIEGGLDGLRAQLVAMLQGFGAQLTNTLEGAGRSIYLTMESRKSMLEEDGKEGVKEGENEGAKEEPKPSS